MGLFSLIANFIYNLVISTIILLIVLPFLPDNLFPDFPLDPVSFEVDDHGQFFQVNKVKWNTLISDKAKVYLKDDVIGPESLAIRGDRLFTGLADGRLVEIGKNNLDNLKTVTKQYTAESGCGDKITTNATNCGRPLGIRFTDDGTLFYVDATKGLFMVEFQPSVRAKHIALGPDSKDKFIGIFNDLALDPNNPDRVYVSVTSTKWKYYQIMWSFVDMHKEGLVLAVDIKTGKHHIVLDDIAFPNGLEISPNKRSLFVATTGEHKVYKIDLADIDAAIQSGKPVTKKPALIEKLPGNPDNIRLFGNDLYIGLPIVSLNSTLSDSLSKLPLVRKSFGRFANLIARLLYQIDRLMPCPCTKELASKFDNGYILHSLIPQNSGVLIIDANTGKPRRILGSSGYPSISEGLLDISSGDLYLGSYRSAYLLKISAKDLK